ncbi:MAG: hypothetical protein WB766_22580 [Roseiarcus sp.]
MGLQGIEIIGKRNGRFLAIVCFQWLEPGLVSLFSPLRTPGDAPPKSNLILAAIIIDDSEKWKDLFAILSIRRAAG